MKVLFVCFSASVVSALRVRSSVHSSGGREDVRTSTLTLRWTNWILEELGQRSRSPQALVALTCEHKRDQISSSLTFGGQRSEVVVI